MQKLSACPNSQSGYGRFGIEIGFFGWFEDHPARQGEFE
jgi:hypothetical protein